MMKSEIIKWAGFEVTIISGASIDFRVELDDCVIISSEESKSGAWEIWSGDEDELEDKIMEVRGAEITDASHVRVAIGAMGAGYISGHRDGTMKVQHAFRKVIDAFSGRSSGDLIQDIVNDTWTDADETAWRKKKASFSSTHI